MGGGLDLLAELREVLASRAFLNAQRILILIALYLAGRLMFTELSKVTGIGKGALEHHLGVLIGEGLVVRRYYLTLRGPRLFLKLTEKGKVEVEKMLEAMSGLGRDC